MHAITPFGVPRCQHCLVLLVDSIGDMDEEGKARLGRLVDYCKRRRTDLISDNEVNPTLFAKEVQKAYTYCRDLLAGQKESFGPRVARELEEKLGMSRWYLDGGADWPFPSIDYEKVNRLSSKALDQLDGALLLVAAQMKIDIRAPLSESGKIRA